MTKETNHRINVFKKKRAEEARTRKPSKKKGTTISGVAKRAVESFRNFVTPPFIKKINEGLSGN